MTTNAALCIGRQGPITVRPGTHTKVADLHLRPMRPVDPPVLLALRDLLSVKVPQLTH